MPGEFFCAATRPPSVYRGNPFLIEVGLAYGATNPTQKVTLDALTEFLAESDAHSVRQFLLTTFDGIGNTGAEKILSEAKLGPRQAPSNGGTMIPRVASAPLRAVGRMLLRVGQLLGGRPRR